MCIHAEVTHTSTSGFLPSSFLPFVPSCFLWLGPALQLSLSIIIIILQFHHFIKIVKPAMQSRIN